MQLQSNKQNHDLHHKIQFNICFPPMHWFKMVFITNFQASYKALYTYDKNNFQVSKLLLLGVSSNNAAIQYTLATKRFDVRLTNS